MSKRRIVSVSEGGAILVFSLFWFYYLSTRLCEVFSSLWTSREERSHEFVSGVPADSNMSLFIYIEYRNVKLSQV